jgi:hypothetical protein
MEIGEQEFHVIKTEQSLLIDFQQFPSMFMELIELCKEFDNYQSPKYFCVFQQLSITDGLLKIIESNTFKQLIHISLKIRLANDEALKKYLSSKVIEFKSKSEDLTRTLNEKEEELKQTGCNLELTDNQLKKISNEHSNYIDNLKIQHQTEITNIKEKLLSE